MKLEKVSIKNFMGLEDLELEPGAVTVISGANGSGKTSCLEALLYSVGGGHDPSVIRRGAEYAEITISLDDGTTIRTRVREKSTTRDITDERGRKITRSAEFIRSIVDALSANPIQLLEAKPDKQLEMLLQAMPLRVTAEDLAFLPPYLLHAVNFDRHALETLGAVEKALTQERREINRVAKEKRATAKQMTETLPEDAPEGDWNAELLAAETESSDLRTSTAAKVTQVRADANAAIQHAKADCETRKQKIIGLRDRKIEELRAEFERMAQKVRDDCAEAASKWDAERDANISAAESARDVQIADLQAAYTPKKAALDERLGHSKAMLEQSAKAEATRQFIVAQEEEAGTLEGQSAELTAAMDKLDALKANLTSSLPVKGLGIREGEIYVDGVPFARVNQARKIQIAIEVARLRAGELGLVLIDDAEHFDGGNFQAFKQAAKRSGLQVIAAKVADSGLTVESEVGA